MADLDREPFWGRKKAWSIDEESQSLKIKLENGKSKPRCQVLPCNGEYGLEYFLSLTLPQFVEAYKELGWDAQEGYTKFLTCLTGDMRISVEETLENEY